jgi:hypothetical protein
MRIPIEICVRHTNHETHLEEAIMVQARKLERFAGDLIRCRITVDRPQESQRSLHWCRCTIRATLPHEEVVVVHQPSDMHGTAEEVVIGAFHAAERQIKNAIERRRAYAKPPWRAPRAGSA